MSHDHEPARRLYETYGAGEYFTPWDQLPEKVRQRWRHAMAAAEPDGSARRIQDLLEANNRYLERARVAEAALTKRTEGFARQALEQFVGATLTEETLAQMIHSLLGEKRKVYAYTYTGDAQTLRSIAESAVARVEAAKLTAEAEDSADKKLAGVIRKLQALHHAFDMKGANSTTMLRAINTLSTMGRIAKGSGHEIAAAGEETASPPTGIAADAYGAQIPFIADCLRNYARILRDGLIDAAGHYLPTDIDHAADILEDEGPSQIDSYIVESGDGKRFRVWKDGVPCWTTDRNEATRYARRQDAEAVHREDDDAWAVVPYRVEASAAPAGEPGEPRALTADEVRDILLKQIKALVHYWSSDAVGAFRPARERCDGVAFSILSMLDGSTLDIPGVDLVFRPHADDKQYSIDNGENWIEPGTTVSDTLHEHYAALGNKA